MQSPLGQSYSRSVQIAPHGVSPKQLLRRRIQSCAFTGIVIPIDLVEGKDFAHRCHGEPTLATPLADKLAEVLVWLGGNLGERADKITKPH
jgi:hypothetical protein